MPHGYGLDVKVVIMVKNYKGASIGYDFDQ